MPNFRLVLEYDGSDFAGWQVQPHGERTVQGALVDAIEKITGERIRVTGAGRTDAGVHAEGQAASVQIPTEMAPDELGRALNGNLPRDVAVVSVTPVPDDFDARRAALGKLYVYRIWNGRRRSPLRLHRAMTVLQPLDLGAMAAGARHFVGEHDFASLQATGTHVATTVRTLRRVDVLGEAGGDVRIEVEGTGFLRYMVRNLAGTLIEVGRGWRAPDSIPGLLEARDRSQAGPTAQARGLTLVRVDYPADGPPVPGPEDRVSQGKPKP